MIPSPEVALELLQRYGVKYVYVGGLERAYYDPLGIQKFETMLANESVKQVYNADDVIIYEVNDG